MSLSLAHRRSEVQVLLLFFDIVVLVVVTVNIIDIVPILVSVISAQEWLPQMKGDCAGPQSKNLRKNHPVFDCELEFHLFGCKYEMKQGDVFRVQQPRISELKVAPCAQATETMACRQDF